MIKQAVKGNKLPIYKGRNYTGQKIGRWLVIGQSNCVRSSGRNYKTKWLCRCECGTERWVTKDNLVRGQTNGCSDCSSRSGASNPNWTGDGVVTGSYWYRVQLGAKQRDIRFDLTIDHLNAIWTGNCALTGWPISISENTASLDRIDSNKDYEAGNVQWIHKDVNLMKNHFSESRFVDVCRAVSRFKKKPK